MYEGLDEADVRSVPALSEPEACFERLLLEDDEEWREVVEVFGRRVRFASAVLVLSAAIDSRLLLFRGGDPLSPSRVLAATDCWVSAGSRCAVEMYGCPTSWVEGLVVSAEREYVRLRW